MRTKKFFIIIFLIFLIPLALNIVDSWIKFYNIFPYDLFQIVEWIELPSLILQLLVFRSFELIGISLGREGWFFEVYLNQLGWIIHFVIYCLIAYAIAKLLGKLYFKIFKNN